MSGLARLNRACGGLLARNGDRPCVELWAFIVGLRRLLEGARGHVVGISPRRIATALLKGGAPRCYELAVCGRGAFLRNTVHRYVRVLIVRGAAEGRHYVVRRVNYRWVVTTDGARMMLELAAQDLERRCGRVLQ